MSSRVLLFLLSFFILAACRAQNAAQWAAETVSAARVVQINGGQETRKAEKGELLEIRGRISHPAPGPKTIGHDEIQLSGQSRSETAASKWDLSPTGVGVELKGSCTYNFADELVKGGVGLGGEEGAILWLRREKEGGPATLEFAKRPVEFCAAFLVPKGATGPLTLKVGTARFKVAWRPNT